MSTTPDPRGERKADHLTSPTWLPGLAIGALGLLAVLGLVFLGGRRDFETTKSPAPVATAPVQKVGPVLPSFDTVRVDAGGNAVIAGRAAPGATVTITANGQKIGTATANSSGSFAFVTTHPLPPGGQQLALSTTTKSGQTLDSQRNVTISVPKAPNEGPLAVLSGNGQTPPQVLSGQGPEPGTLGIGSVDYDSNGHAMIAGTAKPGTEISLSLDGVHLGTAVAGSDGRWTLHTDHMPNKPGTFKLETLSKSGAITGSMQTAFAPRDVGAVEPGHVVVAQGECLWLIARRVYGRGIDYSLIYRANQASIRDPNLVYPGQRLALPHSPTAKTPSPADTGPASSLAGRGVATG